jgi:hypothetical protein
MARQFAVADSAFDQLLAVRDVGLRDAALSRPGTLRRACAARHPLSRGLPTVGCTGAVLIELGQHQAEPLDRVLAQRP